MGGSDVNMQIGRVESRTRHIRLSAFCPVGAKTLSIGRERRGMKR